MARVNRYREIFAALFRKRYKRGGTRLEFSLEDLCRVADEIGVERPKNMPDVRYSLLYRGQMPEEVLATQPKGMEWTIEGAGKGRYELCLVQLSRIVPRDNLATIGIPDGTPEIIRKYALGDEQALLAIVRYNRLIDIFLGLTTYSLQNHLRTTVKGVAQIEIDELYIGIDKHGCHYAIPVQAKGGTDQISVVQAKQDIAWCEQRYPGMRVRAISAQFMSEKRVAMFELTVAGDTVKVVEERHYQLLPEAELDGAAILKYRQ